ncbi:MAG TPA: 3'-5' exonuclease [Gemmatimonadaceae bacterium]|jgi:DNA polymerase-3 subunit epsilon|nr:3'-5' exonuclease [Gemmatimonadaceae bacterium]
MSGLTLGNAETLLTTRAADFLAAGPADPQTLISYVCQLPGAPSNVAEHMAAALFAGHQKFVRGADGRWMLRAAAPAGPAALAGPAARVHPPSSLAALPHAECRPTGDVHGESYVVVDVETTGTSPWAGDRVTEVAVVHVQNGMARTVFDTLINPERSIPPAIVAITNITWEMVKDAPRFADVCDQLLGVLEGNVFVAHNAGFDWRFISAEVERVTRRPLVGRKLCTVRLARRLVPQLRRRNLDSLASFYGIDNAARHRAGGDALATAQILLRLLDAARDRGCASTDDLDDLMNTRTARARRPRRPPAMPQPARDDTTA